MTVSYNADHDRDGTEVPDARLHYKSPISLTGKVPDTANKERNTNPSHQLVNGVQRENR